MKAFWWFKENAVAGMARPGFNCSSWFDFPFEEAVAIGWIGKITTTSAGIADFRKHIFDYGPRIAKFHGLDETGFDRAVDVFETEKGIKKVFDRILKQTKILTAVDISNDKIQLVFNSHRLKYEVDQLREREFTTLVSLTEHHHDWQTLALTFDTHHIAIEDLNAPTKEQAQRLAEILKIAKKFDEKVVVHCLAGIGRTSTMLLAAHILNGENVEDLQALLRKQNPNFILTGKQSEFIQSLK
jgi:predicted protein tyrosine phosphatase